MNLREAARKALDSLDYYRSYSLSWAETDEEAFDSLRTALAEAEEPVAWRTEAAAWLRRQADDAEPESGRTGWANPAHHMPATLRRIAEKLDAEQEEAPFGIECPPSPRREPLTEDEIFQATRKLYSSEEGARFDFPANVEVARLIEQAHGIGGDE